MKKSYQAPRLTVHGTVAELTLGNAAKSPTFDNNFKSGMNVPFDSSGNPLIFS